jgi:CheY-like chemotaxis protein
LRTNTTPVAGSPQDDPPPENLSGTDVLVIEDESDASDATKRFLESAGATVRAVTSATAARDAYSIRPPSIILCDIGLPGEDGYSFLRYIRAYEKDHQLIAVTAIAITAFARDVDRQHALAAGFDEHISKPLDPDRLLGVLAKRGPISQ